MQVKYFAILGALSLSAGNSSTAAPAPEGRVLYHTNEMAYLDLQSDKVRGSVNGQTFDVFIEKRKNVLYMVVTSKERSFGQYTIALNRLSKLDVASAVYFARAKPKAVVKIEMRYGEERDCFVNDDGRDRLTAVFESGKRPDAYKISYHGCLPNVMKL